MRYFLAQDSSSHWYIVDAARREDWEWWSNLPEDDDAAWAQHVYATRIDGSPSRVEFSSPIEL